MENKKIKLGDLWKLILVLSGVVAYSVGYTSYLQDRYVTKDSFNLICQHLGKIEDKLDWLVQEHVKP